MFMSMVRSKKPGWIYLLLIVINILTYYSWHSPWRSGIVALRIKCALTMPRKSPFSIVLMPEEEQELQHRAAKYTLPYCPVSYTHLRAHETDSYLVCRLLLEKKK